jgi:PknH-like extracellular domain
VGCVFGAACGERTTRKRKLRVNRAARQEVEDGGLRCATKRFVALSAIVMLAVGCGGGVGVGRLAQPAANSTSRTLTGQTIDRVLLGGKSLSRILKQPLKIDSRFPPRFGGAEALRDDGWDSPAGCVGVASMLQQDVYQASNVKGVAAEAFRHAARSEVTSVKEGVVSLPAAADASALFAKFSRHWQKCDGTTLSLPGSLFRLDARITNVQAATSVLAATVSIGWKRSGSNSASIPAGRAIAVRDNCLVEVEVDFFDASIQSVHGSGDFDATAIDVARAMLDKVGALI